MEEDERMLCLTGKREDRFFLLLPDGREIRVVLRGFDRGVHWLGFEAPGDVLIYRESVLRQIQAKEADRLSAASAGCEPRPGEGCETEDGPIGE